MMHITSLYEKMRTIICNSSVEKRIWYKNVPNDFTLWKTIEYFFVKMSSTKCNFTCKVKNNDIMIDN